MRKRKELAQPGDIAFLLIIFFLLLAGVGASRAIPLKVEPSSGGEDTVGRTLSVTLRQDGRVATATGVLEIEQLAAEFDAATRLTLMVEGQTRWQQVVHTLSLISQSPAASVNLEEVP
ncbi:MAG: biopolymer transporter ExbD [Sphaerochaetaceae bacterium]|nr:biopolymer transporter ExbD [Sphaerochaetaceae bacterium]